MRTSALRATCCAATADYDSDVTRQEDEEDGAEDDIGDAPVPESNSDDCMLLEESDPADAAPMFLPDPAGAANLVPCSLPGRHPHVFFSGIPSHQRCPHVPSYTRSHPFLCAIKPSRALVESCTKRSRRFDPVFDINPVIRLKPPVIRLKPPVTRSMMSRGALPPVAPAGFRASTPEAPGITQVRGNLGADPKSLTPRMVQPRHRQSA